MSDKISELPDSLLQHILSCLPTKQAIATSLLSKRWRPLWRGLSTFDVDDVDFKSFHSLAQFVDAVLILRDSTPLKKFRIYCKQYYSFLLPHHIVANQITVCTIQELRLSQVEVANLSHVNLPSLKLMSLSKVRFPDFKCVATLLSGCPLLEKLVLSDLDIRNKNISTVLMLEVFNIWPQHIFQLDGDHESFLYC
ncbi:hypothetical protein QN277_024971 [Acacia crassicarpa]|uniref:F-box domain-containing protein n=1 Tax=Acacia crassicarpa TaxID=499986 RepID=A0AAE1K8I4_9FABA|nr:hypothetical protein QN277_024971 [Acacia crassicarpa]